MDPAGPRQRRAVPGTLAQPGYAFATYAAGRAAALRRSLIVSRVGRFLPRYAVERGARGPWSAAKGGCGLSRRLPSEPKLYTLRGVSAVYDDCNVNPEITDYSFVALLVRPGETGVVCRYEHTQSNE